MRSKSHPFFIAILSLASAAAVLGTAFYQAMPSGSHIQDRVLQILRQHDAELISASGIPSELVNAVVAAEDERFYQHGGVDPVAVGRAALFDVSNACWCQGGSTITQQLVKVVYLHGSDQGAKKLVDAALAVKVESVIDKSQILADYVSVVPTGPQLVGVEQASCAYFRRPVADLPISDVALLAGLTQAPNLYDPLTHPAAARQRRKEVLASMVADGFISDEQARIAADQPLTRVGGAAAC